MFASCVSHAFESVHCCLVATCLERADLLALVCDVYCAFVTFPCGIPGQVWYLIVSFPDLCRLSFFCWPVFYWSGESIFQLSINVHAILSL